VRAGRRIMPDRLALCENARATCRPILIPDP
jgi:hypothetical protein